VTNDGAGVVDQNVDASELCERLVDKRERPSVVERSALKAADFLPVAEICCAVSVAGRRFP